MSFQILDLPGDEPSVAVRMFEPVLDLKSTRAFFSRMGKRNLRSYCGGRPSPHRLARGLRAGNGLVAETGGRIIGFGELAADEHGRLYVAVCVDRDWRERGVARLLLEALMTIARARGRQTVYALVRTDNETTTKTLSGMPGVQTLTDAPKGRVRYAIEL